MNAQRITRRGFARTVAAAAAAFVGVAASLTSAASLTPLGYPPGADPASRGSGVSADGSVVVGQSCEMTRGAARSRSLPWAPASVSWAS